VFILIPVSIIVTWLYNRCGGTILSAALFHSAFNVAPDFVPSAEWAGWTIAALALVLVGTDRMWRKTDRTAVIVPESDRESRRERAAKLTRSLGRTH
jgi:hypothetical protein